MATIVVTSISIRPLTLLRKLIDTFFAVNILAIFLEVILQQNLFFEYLAGSVVTRISRSTRVPKMGPLEGRVLFWSLPRCRIAFWRIFYRKSRSTPVNFSTTTIVRISLSLLSYMAIFPTGGRSSWSQPPSFCCCT